MKTIKNKYWEKIKIIRYFPFEHPKAGTLVYSFIAGIFASLAAQLFITPPLNPTPRICSSILIISALLFSISSLLMIFIGFEIEAFKEDLIHEGSPRDKDTRRLILEKRGVKSEGFETPRKQFSRLWRLWIYLGIFILSAICAIILMWTE